MEKDLKSELILWVIIGIMIGLFILFMPDLERLIFGRAKKDKNPPKVEEKEPVEKSKNGTLSCGKTDGQASVKYEIYYEDNKALKETITRLTIFNNENEVTDAVKKECDDFKTTYANQTGFTAACNINGLTMTKKYVMDLNTYKGFKIITANGEETFTKDIEYKQSINDVTKKMATLGATCK